MKRSPLRSRSKKRSAEMVERRKLVARLLTERPWCEAGIVGVCWGRAVDVHEILPRSQGGRIIGGGDDEYLTLCRPCHSWITDHPREAKEKGWLRGVKE